VAGHEAAGRIEAIGSSVSQWRVGQRVGAGFFGGKTVTVTFSAEEISSIARASQISGITVDGGHAEMMVADTNAAMSLPDSLNAVEAARFFALEYSALRNAPLRSGDLVAVQGIGGLGHLGIQFAQRMGLRTGAIARGSEKGSWPRNSAACPISMRRLRISQRRCNAWAEPRSSSRLPRARARWDP
jgi:D-arabinose 1-dehydrogenase-like Zn-dependent alcohol dehydrogenase